MGERQLQALGHRVQLRPVLLLGGEPVERVGAGFDQVAVCPLQLDRHQDVADLDRVPARRVHADQVVTELRHDRLGHLTGSQVLDRIQKRPHIAARVGVNPAEVAAAGGAARVGRLRLGDGVERFAAQHSSPQRPRPRQGGGAVRRVRAPWQGDEAQIRDRRPLERVPMRFEIALSLDVRHRRRAVEDYRGCHRQSGDRHRVALVPVHPP